MTKQTKGVSVVIPAPNIQAVTIKIKGTSPLIFHKWSNKAIQMIEDKQTKAAVANKKKDARDPEGEYRESFYLNRDGEVAFPALSIKQALVNSARVLDGVAMTQIRATIFIAGDEDGLIPVKTGGKTIKLGAKVQKDEETANIVGHEKKFPNVEMRRDMVRIGMGSADIRYRGQVKDWEMDLFIKYNADVFSLQQVMNLLQTAGFSVGIGEWRPERSGDFGTFEIVAHRE